MKLKDKIAIVTGAGEGIGRGIALALAREGADVAVCARNRAGVEETARQIAELGRRTHFGFFDVADEAAIIQFVTETNQRLGPPTVLVPNAATMPWVNLVDMSAAEMDTCYSVKVRSSALLVKHCIPYMQAVRSGSIVFMASVTGNTGFPKLAFYGAMNAALIAMARGLAMELAPFGVRVNSVSPGTVDSPMLHRFAVELGSNMTTMRPIFNAAHPRGQVASIDEIAATFAFLAGSDAANITATDLRCDGGFSFKGGQASDL
jgi:NAD(P)-dependent dehydrogenase (short-subunit alcohol dehydrogenase family)